MGRQGFHENKKGYSWSFITLKCHPQGIWQKKEHNIRIEQINGSPFK